MAKILIIKVGHSETLDPEVSSLTSYGDVLRTTVLLHQFKDDRVTWLVDEKAYPILKENEYIDRILIYNLTSVLQLRAEEFDTVINLEKVPGLCALADSIKAWRRFGFRFDSKEGVADAYDGSQDVLSMCRDIEKKRRHAFYWQDRLYEMIGAKWMGQEYVLGYKPKSHEVYDVGFNYKVGNKWPAKMWDEKNWKRLEKIIGDKYSISWQQGLNSMEEYFEWINSCRMIVSNDSFGFHLALALKKKAICMCGPTNHKEHFCYDRGKVVIPKNVACKKFPCHNQAPCSEEISCLQYITPQEIINEIEILFNKKEKIKHEYFANTQRV